jgi:hypothetical protein
LTEEQILAWADSYHQRTGQWPLIESGPIEGIPGETWRNVDAALRRGGRGLPRRTSLPKILAERRGVRNRLDLPDLSVERILTWADAHHERTGKWPKSSSGAIEHAPGETWTAVSVALVQGIRGLPGGSSLAKVLAEHRGVRNRGELPMLSESLILKWSDAYYERRGNWPKVLSGPVEGTTETWMGLNQALDQGSRGLPGGSSLARLLAKHRGVQNRRDLPALSSRQILEWADAHRRRHGRWPTKNSGTVDHVPVETWAGINTALKRGSRGLLGGSSLARLIKEHRGSPPS